MTDNAKTVVVMNDRWDDSTVPHTALAVNVVDNGSTSGSLLADLQRNSTSLFSVDKTGAVVAAAGLTLGGALTLTGSVTASGPAANAAAAPTIASATTIAPVKPVSFVSGTTDVVNLTVPAAFASKGGSVTLIPTGAWSTTNAGNIAIATTAVVSKALTMTYDSGTAKWYPSY